MKFFPKKLNLTWLNSAYKNGDLSPQELLEEIIRRAEETAEKNIWIVPPSKELVQKYIDNLPKDRENYPLWGIPFAIKDNIDLADVPTTAACKEFTYTPKKSAFVVQNLIDAGAIPVGKTNLDQFATGLVGTRSPYGEVHNSHNPDLISGGSSSGSSVSVALGMATFSLGTDTAGSGRVPAMLNTLVGFKPPLGSWSTAGVVPACASLDCVTVFANSLGDAKIVDSQARGFDKDCIWSKEYEIKGEKSAKTIFLPKTEPRFYGDYADICRKKWQNAVKRIEKLPINIEYIDYKMFSDAALILYEGAYVAERWEDLKSFIENSEGKTFPVTEKILRSGDKAENTAAKLFGNLHELQMYRHKAKMLLKDAVMVMPTAGGTFSRAQVRENPIETNSLMGLYTNHCNLLDMFAVAIPENTKDTNIPFGITVFGLSDSENLVLDMCEKFLESESLKICVCGIHKKGRALESQLTELGAEFSEHTTTAKEYKLYELDTKPLKPGLVRVLDGGECIEVDVYSLPKTKLASFMENVSSPLNIGDVKLINGEYIKGFLCENYIIETAKDITDKKSF